MSTSSQDIHKLYHEAKRRASQPQPLIKFKDDQSLLLSAPNNIIFELFNTVIKDVSAEKLFDFVRTNLKDYLSYNWSNKITKRAIERLKREQTVDVRAGLRDAPSIKYGYSHAKSKSPSTQHEHSPTSSRISSPNIESSKLQSQDSTSIRMPSASRSQRESNRPKASSLNHVVGKRSPPLDYGSSASKQVVIDQVYEHIMWRIQTDNVTQIISLLIKVMLDDGYKKGKLKVEAYDEVAKSFSDWRSNKLIKLYAFGSAPASDQKLILANTTSGDLTKWIANYIDGSDKRHGPDLVRVLATSLRDKTNNCIFITNELIDSLNALDSGVIRCVLLVDRVNQYQESLEFPPELSSKVKTLITSGKLYVVNSLACVLFVPDPSNDTCC